MIAPSLLFGLFGLIIGSFLNVVILRRGIKSLSGRSGCFSCGGQLHARDMIPVVSWLLLRGRCRQCGSGMSIQYPLVEAGTALLFALIGGIPGITAAHAAFMCVVACFLILISAYDIRHTIIPDEWAYAFAVLALASSFIFRGSEMPLIFELLAGPFAAAPLFALWLVSRGRWMGLGDAKLSLGIGWLLGPVTGVFAVFFAFVIGAVFALGFLLPLPHVLKALKKAGIVRHVSRASYTMKSEVPFGPFLIASCLYVWFFTLYSIPIIGMP